MQAKVPRQEPYEAFGQHLTLDGYGCPAGRLADLPLVYRFLEEAPGLIDMTVIMGPWADVYDPPPDKPREDWGLSGCVIIAESHISVHTFPDKGFISLDIFSCKPFDQELAVAHAVETFGVQRHETNMLDRGLEFPRNMRMAAGITTSQREEITFMGGESGRG
jgi:S-adenosylmethionine decarboxylase